VPCSCSRRSFLRLGALAGGALIARPALASPASTADVPVLRSGGPAQVGGLQVLAGSLHDHSTDSDGDAPSETIATYVRAHARELGLDFLSLTEHSDLFPGSSAGADPWGRSLDVCTRYSGDGFAFLRGFEWTNDQQNHLNVIGSQGWVRRDEAFTMAPFWRWLASEPGPVVSPLAPSLGGADGWGQFNHPSSKGPLNWDDYALDAPAAERMATIEVREGAAGWYWFALLRGWTVGPVMNADFHPWAASGLLANTAPGRQAGGSGFYPGLRTLVVARDASVGALMEGLGARRSAASSAPDLWATLRTTEGAWMGSTVELRGGGPKKPHPQGKPRKDRPGVLELVVDAGTRDSAITSVELVQDLPLDDRVAAHYFRSNALGEEGQHTLAYVEQQRRYELSGGRATFKGSQDAPPPGATLPAVPWEAGARTLRLTWEPPATASPRPDGKHWVYAVVRRADGHRVTTAPLLVDGD
jgi:hypothetical protein